MLYKSLHYKLQGQKTGQSNDEENELQNDQAICCKLYTNSPQLLLAMAPCVCRVKVWVV